MENNKKENKTNYIFIILSILVTILMVYILVTLIDSTKPPKESENDILLKEKCDIQAKKILITYEKKHENDGGLNIKKNPNPTRVNFDQKNHFNKKENKCYVLLIYNFTEMGTSNPNFIEEGELLFDVYRNIELGNCVHAERITHKDFPGRYVDRCVIGKNKATLDSYNNFVYEKMELK